MEINERKHHSLHAILGFLDAEKEHENNRCLGSRFKTVVPFSVNFVFALSMAISGKERERDRTRVEWSRENKPFGVSSVDVRDFLDPLAPILTVVIERRNIDRALQRKSNPMTTVLSDSNSSTQMIQLSIW